jgi:hypothetical protein
MGRLFKESVQVRGSFMIFETIFFMVKGLLAPRPTPKLEGHHFSFVRGCLFNIFAATLHSWRPSSILNPRARHAVVTGTDLS